MKSEDIKFSTAEYLGILLAAFLGWAFVSLAIIALG